MSVRESESLFARLQKFALLGSQVGGLVPVEDFATYYLLATEIARMAASDGGEDLRILLDARTATQVDAVGSAQQAASRVFVFGPPPESWAAAPNVTACPKSPAFVKNRDLFLMAMSDNLTLALVCEQIGDAFQGVWTGLRTLVTKCGQTLLSAPEVADEARAFLEPQALPAENRSLACSLRLMELITRQLAWRQRDIAHDKADLFSVLNILKAVSAKRGVHDILYVFSKQIAQAIRVDRCSVVRVWEGDERGHVLASHDDENITDLVIDLGKYPEIAQAMETHQKVIINDAQHEPMMIPFVEALTLAHINSLLIIPVVLFDQNVGSFLLRAVRGSGTFNLREVSFCEIVAAATANSLERAHLYESMKRANEQLEFLAVTDGLTGVYNRRFFRQRIEDEFERARRYKLPLSCMIMDVDDFKTVNDTYGHLIGDTVLRGIAATLLQSVRKSDVVARYGGEEFVVIMPQTGAAGAQIEAERVRREIGQREFEGLPKERSVTVSIGVSVYSMETMGDCEALIRLADGALYSAKRTGKNRVVMGQPENPDTPEKGDNP